MEGKLGEEGLGLQVDGYGGQTGQTVGEWTGEFHGEDLVTSGKGWGLRWPQVEQSVDVSLFNRYTKEEKYRTHAKQRRTLSQ